jgi:Transposase domain (DUF772)
MERLEFDLLFRWFVGIGVDVAAWDHSVFSKNRERLLEGAIAAKLLSAVLAQSRVKRLLSMNHFSVDGTLIEAWASMKSFKPKDARTNRPRTGADGTGRRTFTARSAQTTHTPRPPIPRQGSIAKGQARRRSSSSWARLGFDEMDEVSGDGSAELLDDGSIKIEFAYHNGDEAVLKAK